MANHKWSTKYRREAYQALAPNLFLGVVRKLGVEGMFGIALSALHPPKSTMDLIILSKHILTIKSESTKNLDSRARSMDFMEHLNLNFVPHRVRGNYPPMPLIKQHQPPPI